MTSDVRAALEAGDDGFHEIQLNGKQLVFLGMATTLVSVVVFLCGVLVGRGVKPLDTVAQAAGPQVFDTPVSSPVAPGAIATPAPAPPATPAPSGGGTAVAAAAAAGSAGDTEPTPLGDEPDPSASAPASGLAAATPAKPAAVEPKTAKVEPREAAKPKPVPVQASAAPPAPVAAAPKPTPAPAPAPAAVATAAQASASGAIAVQVGAFATRKEADTLAKRLSGRGYAVYVMNPTGDGKNVYRVRVGNYGTADEAQRVSARLTQQENLKPWITR
jgi:DedD protein